ncbi:hypothetical protein EIP86_005266 [Pleurotus ostreatoroseus]|nr:hypothetical protein EIP86_005266 [Pleurotus ostreatoroseus]
MNSGEHVLEAALLELSRKKPKERPPPLSARSEWAPIALAFASGTAVILALYKPRTYARRLTVLGLGCGAWAADRFLTRNSVSSSANLRWSLGAAAGADDDRFSNGLPKIALWIPTLIYSGGKGSTGYELRQSALKKLHARLSNKALLGYLERERTHNGEISMGKRLAFKWHNLWSTARTRAGVDDVIRVYLSTASKWQHNGLRAAIPEHDIRHFVTYTANALEHNWLENPSLNIQRATFYGSVAVGALGAGAWVGAAAVVGLGSFIVPFGHILRSTQHCEGPLKYAKPEMTSFLNLFWYDWAHNDAGLWKELERAASRT